MNATGFIIAHGGMSSDGDIHALLLTCPIDFDGSMAVGAGDLSILLGEWGKCEDCGADLSFDGEIDEVDMGILLGAWTDGNGYCTVGIDSMLCPDSFSSFSSGGVADWLMPALLLLGFESAEDFAAWGAGASDSELSDAGNLLKSYMPN